jgi:hypothetical protein
MDDTQVSAVAEESERLTKLEAKVDSMHGMLEQLLNKSSQ